MKYSGRKKARDLNQVDDRKTERDEEGQEKDTKGHKRVGTKKNKLETQANIYE